MSNNQQMNMSKMEEEFRGRVPADRPVFFEPTELKRCHSRVPGEILTDEEERFEAASIKERANTVWSWTHLTRWDDLVPAQLTQQVASCGVPLLPALPELLHQQKMKLMNIQFLEAYEIIKKLAYTDRHAGYPEQYYNSQAYLDDLKRDYNDKMRDARDYNDKMRDARV